MNCLINTSDDLNYDQAILDGSWPGSVEILTRALARAETKAKELEAREAKEGT
jgi:hypothetical protein